MPVVLWGHRLKLKRASRTQGDGSRPKSRWCICTSLRTLAERRSGSGARARARAAMPSLSGNAAHLILLQAPAGASGRSSSGGAGGWARGWHSRPVEPKLVEHMHAGATMGSPFGRGDAGPCPLLRARRLCVKSFSCTHLSSVHASHISQLLQLAPWSTPKGPLMQCKCQPASTDPGGV